MSQFLFDILKPPAIYKYNSNLRMKFQYYQGSLSLLSQHMELQRR